MKTAIALLAGVIALSGQVRLPPYTRQVLTNGAVLDVMPRKDVPLITISVLFKGGTEADPAELSGLANVTAEAVRRGTAKRTADQFAQELDSLGATLSTGADFQSIRIEAEFLSSGWPGSRTAGPPRAVRRADPRGPTAW